MLLRQELLADGDSRRARTGFAPAGESGQSRGDVLSRGAGTVDDHTAAGNDYSAVTATFAAERTGYFPSLTGVIISRVTTKCFPTLPCLSKKSPGVTSIGPMLPAE